MSDELDTDIISYLDTIYFDIDDPGAYSSPLQLYNSVKSKGIKKISLRQIKQYLKTQDSYTEFFKKRERFPREKFITPDKNYMLGADTINYKNLSSYNNGYKYIALFVNLFTGYAYAYPLKTLQSNEMKKVIEQLFLTFKPKFISSDKGSEYLGVVPQYLSDENVKQIFSTNSVKQSPAERKIKDIRLKLARIFNKTLDYNWVKILPKVMKSLNNSYNRVLKTSAKKAQFDLPNSVIWYRRNPPTRDKKRSLKKETALKKIKFKFDIDDIVKIANLGSKFTRIRDETFSTELFKIISRTIKNNLEKYKIKDFNNEVIVGSFYKDQLVHSHATTSKEKEYKVEKIIKKRTRNGLKEILVKWVDYGKKFNSWIPQSYIRDIK